MLLEIRVDGHRWVNLYNRASKEFVRIVVLGHPDLSHWRRCPICRGWREVVESKKSGRRVLSFTVACRECRVWQDGTIEVKR